MKPKPKFMVSIVMLTVLLIGFLSLSFIMGVLISVEEITVERIGLLILGVAFSVLIFSKIYKLNKKETQRRISSSSKGQQEFITEWIIPKAEWRVYVEQKFAYDKSESSGYGYVFGGIIGVIALFMTYNSYPLGYVALIGLGTFIVFFLLGKYVALFQAKRGFKRFSQLDRGEINFAKEAIIFNGQLITLNDFGQSLSSFNKVEKFGVLLFSCVVKTGIGYRSTTREHLIPIPQDKDEEADQLQAYYSGLI